MDEELELAIALSLSAEESKSSERRPNTAPISTNTGVYVGRIADSNSNMSPAQSSVDKDYLFAKKLQEEEQSGSNSSTSLSSAHDAANDFQLAMKLNEINLNQEQMRHQNKNNDIKQSSAERPVSADSISASHSKPSSQPSSSLLSSGVCGKCHTDIYPFIPHLEVKGTKYHKNCFVCGGCDDMISGSFITHKTTNMPYHPQCYDIFVRPRCYVCTECLPPSYIPCNKILDPSGVGCCPSHTTACRMCFACHRLEPLPVTGKDGYSVLADGRSLCLDCIQTAVLDSGEARPLYLAAVDFIEHQLNLPIPAGMREVPVLAVDSAVLNEQWNSMGGSSPHGVSEGPSGSTLRGLTVSTVGELRHYAPGGNYWDPNYGLSELPPTMIHLEQVRNVTAVLVLYCLPREVIASILAHEAMHVWIRLQKDMPAKLNPEVEEGLCQLIASRYLGDPEGGPDGETSSGSRGDWEDRLRRYCQFQIETDPTPVYGDGFRNAAHCCNALGLEILLEHVKETGKFPVIS